MSTWAAPAVSAKAIVVPVTTFASANSATQDEQSSSTGHPYAVTADTRIQYFPPLRVWFDTEGSLLVCPTPGETYTFSSRRCELPDNRDVGAGWVALTALKRPGYAVAAVQVNETPRGPSLVIYWRLLPRTAK